MPLSINPIKNSSTSGFVWTVEDEDELARMVARVYLGHWNHVQKILMKLGKGAPPVADGAVIEAKARLKVNGTPWHRDGLLFQAISWIAAHKLSGSTPSVISLPHLIPAHKGFDGIQIELDEQHELRGVLVFEDKASENPRAIITSEVWPEFRLLESGARETELMQETTALLQRGQVPDIDEIIEGIVWKKIRKFRVSVTGEPKHGTVSGFAKLFKDYEAVAPGTDPAKRRAEVICLADVRVWLSAFAKLVEQAIDKEKSGSV
jgi:hypothetical protein